MTDRHQRSRLRPSSEASQDVDKVVNAQDRPGVQMAVSGYGRSGSTLLESMLLESSGGIAVGEVKNLWSRGLIRNELCSCGRPTTDCDFWKRVIARTFPNGFNPEDVERLRLRVERHRIFLMRRFIGISSAAYEADRSRYVEILKRLYDAIAVEAQTGLIIDSSKDPAHADLLKQAHPQTKIIHLVRDPRAVAFSFSKPKVRPEVHWKKEYMGTRSTVRACLDWVFINVSIDRVLSKNGEFLRLRYEDLARKIIVPYQISKSLDVSAATPVGSHSVSGNPIRFSTKSQDVRIDKRWVSEMPSLRRAVVALLTFPLMIKYGYFKD